MRLQDAKDLLNMARDIMCQEAGIMSHIDGTENLAAIVQMDIQVYSLLSKALDILDNYED